MIPRVFAGHGQEIVIRDVGHVSMLFSPSVLRLVGDFLGEPDPRVAKARVWRTPRVSERERLHEQREATVRRHMEAENVHDFDTVIATFSHPRYELIPSGAIHDGEAAVRGYFRETRTAFPDQRNELISLRHADDAVVVEFWLLGTHRGPIAGFAPTGREFKCRMTALFLFEGAKIVCERVYFDSATILRQLTG